MCGARLLPVAGCRLPLFLGNVGVVADVRYLWIAGRDTLEAEQPTSWHENKSLNTCGMLNVDVTLYTCGLGA